MSLSPHSYFCVLFYNHMSQVLLIFFSINSNIVSVKITYWWYWYELLFLCICYLFVLSFSRNKNMSNPLLIAGFISTATSIQNSLFLSLLVTVFQLYKCLQKQFGKIKDHLFSEKYNSWFMQHISINCFPTIEFSLIFMEQSNLTLAIVYMGRHTV